MVGYQIDILYRPFHATKLWGKIFPLFRKKCERVLRKMGVREEEKEKKVRVCEREKEREREMERVNKC